MGDLSARLRDLPSLDRVLRSSAGAGLVERYGRAAATAALRGALDGARTRLRERGAVAVPDHEVLVDEAEAALAADARPTLGAVLNLTGTVLHTNLGRAVLAEAAIEAAQAAMRDAVALEYDLETGKRGERDDHVRDLLRDLTGAEDATIVNNNAAAVLLVLNTFGKDRDAVVSRGELIEIGGSFRMPAIMERAGTRLREVGTTNRTHPGDYEDALGPQTGLVLKVHTSNYRVEGFTAEVGARDLAAIARRHGVPFVNDLGSGTLVDLAAYGMRHEPTVREAVEEGADLVTFSGDKLLGGPQAGFVVGRTDLVAKLNRNPMKRALRLDKIRLAALAATLKLYRDPDTLADRLPTLARLTRLPADIRAQADRLGPEIARRLGPAWRVAVTECRSQIGSGALPLDTLDSAGLAIAPVAPGRGGVDGLAAALRRLPVPVIGRIHEGRLLLDLRCLSSDAALLATLDGWRPEAVEARA